MTKSKVPLMDVNVLIALAAAWFRKGHRFATSPSRRYVSEIEAILKDGTAPLKECQPFDPSSGGTGGVVISVRESEDFGISEQENREIDFFALPTPNFSSRSRSKLVQADVWRAIHF